jgi:hypothetical protein
LDTQLQTSGAVRQGRVLAMHHLYKQYAGMLLGYILGVVKNRIIAEEYLIAVFKDAHYEFDTFSTKGGNTFCQLKKMACNKLAAYGVKHNDYTASAPVALMNKDQQHVFCGAYWQGKTIDMLAAELEKPEEAIRRILKECFSIIKNGSK